MDTPENENSTPNDDGGPPIDTGAGQPGGDKIKPRRRNAVTIDLSDDGVQLARFLGISEEDLATRATAHYVQEMAAKARAILREKMPF